MATPAGVPIYGVADHSAVKNKFPGLLRFARKDTINRHLNNNKTMTKLYLISPPDFDLEDFDKKLREILQECEVPVFQLRLKNKTDQEVKTYAQKLLETCNELNCMFILNDYVDIALEIGAHGVHVGCDDKNIADIRQKAGENFMIGASCYDSRDLALQAELDGANYISFGAFFPTTTKKTTSRPSLSIVKWAQEMLNLPITAIGGISPVNCKGLVQSEVDFICVISYIWDNEAGPCAAIKEFSL